MASSLLVACRKRRRSSSSENLRLHRRDGGMRLQSSGKPTSSEDCHGRSCARVCVCLPSATPCAKQTSKSCDVECARSDENCASSFSLCIAGQAKSQDSTGSSCCSSLPGYESSHTQRQMPGCEAESESWSCCGSSGGEVDIAAFLHEEEVADDASNEAFSFDPEIVFVNDAGFSDYCNIVEDATFIGFSAENGSWFLNELESEGRDCFNEVLDQEWMATAVANLEKLNDALTSDSCVLHLLEADYVDKIF